MSNAYFGFGRAFFDDLGEITAGDIEEARERFNVPYPMYVRVKHLRDISAVGEKFYQTTVNIFSYLMENTSPRGNRYLFDAEFKVHSPGHILDFTRYRAFQAQYNIGFTAGEDENEDRVRVGLGFRIDTTSSEDKRIDGAEQYWHYFKDVLRNKPKETKTIFKKYNIVPEAYNNDKEANLPDIKSIIADQIDTPHAWRFFGHHLSPSDSTDKKILGNFNRFMEHCHEVFDDINEWLDPYIVIR